MAANADFLYRGMAGYLSRRSGIAVETVETAPWWEREHLLDREVAQLGAVCGLDYVRKASTSRPALELLGAPVPRGRRYGGRSVYYSDVVVRHDSPYRTFADLRGASWAYNEPGSH